MLSSERLVQFVFRFVKKSWPLRHFDNLNKIAIMLSSEILVQLGVDFVKEGPCGSMSQVVGLPSNSYKHITNTAWVRARLCKLQKGGTRLAAASEKVYQLLTQGRWFSLGTPASSTTKTGRHDIAEILLKVALNTNNQINQIIHFVKKPSSLKKVNPTSV